MRPTYPTRCAYVEPKSVSPCVAAAQYREATKVFDRMPDEGQGLTLVHFSPQPEPFLTQYTP